MSIKASIKVMQHTHLPSMVSPPIQIVTGRLVGPLGADAMDRAPKFLCAIFCNSYRRTFMQILLTV